MSPHRRSTGKLWDDGVEWYLDQVAVPTGLAIDVAYFAEQHLRIPLSGAESARLTRAIEASTQQAERMLERSLLPQTWDLVMDRFPFLFIELQRPPLISVTSVQYVDEDGDTQTLDSSQFRVIQQTGPRARRSWIERDEDVTWPVTRRQSDAVTVTYRAGYVETIGASPEVTKVPEAILEGIAIRAAEFYKQRSDSVIGFGVSVHPAIVASRNLWHDFKVY